MGAPAWFDHAVNDGVMALYVLRLPDTPPAATIVACCEVWVRSLWARRRDGWQPDDAPAIAAAFVALAASARRWPAPAELLDAIDSRRTPRLTLPPPPISDSQRARAVAALAALRCALRQPAQGSTFSAFHDLQNPARPAAKSPEN